MIVIVAVIRVDRQSTFTVIAIKKFKVKQMMGIVKQWIRRLLATNTNTNTYTKKKLEETKKKFVNK